MARSKMAEELKKKQAKENRLRAEEDAKAKKKKEIRQAQKRGKSDHKRKEPREPEKEISIQEPASQPHTKKAKLSDKGKTKQKMVEQEPSDSDSDDPLSPEPGAKWAPPSKRRYVSNEPVEENPNIGSTGHPKKKLGSVPTSHKEKPTRQTGAMKQPKQTWEEFLKNKGFKSERYIKAEAFDPDSEVIKVLRRRELTSWMKRGKGYKQGLVRHFYTTAVKDIESATVIAKMSSKKTVKITPDDIGKYLGIERPMDEEVEYPHIDFESMGRAESMKTICIDPNPPKDDGQTFPIGNMLPEYATMNKLIHTNLYAKGSESASKQGEVDLLIEFMGEAVIDVAAWIFEDLVLYITDRPNRLMPFPQMVTQLCYDQGVTSAETYTFGEGGITPAASSMGPRAKAEAARSMQMQKGMRSRRTSSSVEPQSAVPVPTIHEMQQSIQADIQSMNANIGRVLRRQEIQWKIQMTQHAWSQSMSQILGVAPPLPVPEAFQAEFGQPAPAVPPIEEEPAVREEDDFEGVGNDIMEEEEAADPNAAK